MQKTRYRLLIFSRIGWRLSSYVFFVMALLAGVIALDAFWQPFLEEYTLYVWGMLSVLIAVFLYLFIWFGRKFVIIHKDHLFVQGAFSGLVIPYDKVISVTPSRLSKEYPMEVLSTSEWRRWSAVYDEPCALVSLHEYPASMVSRWLWFPKFLFANQRPGILLLVDDWIALSKVVEEHRSQWRRKQHRTITGDKTRIDSTDPILFDDTMLEESELPQILIIASAAIDKEQMTRVLKDQYDLLWSNDGIEALQSARQNVPDLILMPVNPSKMRGAAVLQALRSNRALRETPVIVMAAPEERGACMVILEAGANDFLDLPLSKGALTFRLNNWLRVRGREKELHELNDLLHAKTLDQMAELVRRGELLHFLPATVAQEIMSGQIGQNQAELFKRQQVTVLFIDIVGFTDLTGRLDPDILSELLNEYLREMTAVANKFNGTVDKFIGDAVMVLFGAPQEKNEAEQAWQAAQTALKMMQAVEGLSMIWESRLPRPLQVRIGFNTGSCTAGVFGNEMLRSYTVVGSAVNIAARLQSAASPGTIVFSAESYQYIQNQVHIRELGYLNLKGVNHPVEAYQLLELGRPYR